MQNRDAGAVHFEIVPTPGIINQQKKQLHIATCRYSTISYTISYNVIKPAPFHANEIPGVVVDYL
jgi:hypothetical protein